MQPFSRRLQLVAAAAIFCLGSAAFGQKIEIADLEASALSNSPALAEVASLRDAAIARAEAAGLAADPRLELWGRNLRPDSNGSGPGLEVEIVQPVRFPGKREAERAVASAEVALAEAELEAKRRAILAELRIEFSRLTAADREQRSLAESHELLDLLTETARVRYGAAQDGALAVLEAELAGDEHDFELDRVYAGYLATRARLAALAGVEPEKLPVLAGTRPDTVLPPFQEKFAIDPEAPRFAVAQRRIDLAQRRLERARLELRPDFSLGGGFSWEESEDPALIARAGVELPFLRRRRVSAAIRAAEAEVAGAQAAARSVALEATALAIRFAAERDRIETALTRLTAAVIPRSSAALEAARIAFLEGQLPFARMIELQNDWFDARVELAKVESERYALWAQWQELAPAMARGAAAGDPPRDRVDVPTVSPESEVRP